ncbi:MAG: hypothetical protein GAK43_01329 [Stenotrophomonas maltophilia]|nr:MAG: hypothetical protein GAK43_01329 [Stenotrophomonas maltophilia]
MKHLSNKVCVHATCPRCGGNDFIASNSKCDPRTQEAVRQVMCVERACQEILGVMPLSSLQRRSEPRWGLLR